MTERKKYGWTAKGIVGIIFLVALFYVVGVSGVYDGTATMMVMTVLNIILFTVILALLSFIFSLIGMIKGITSRNTAAIVIAENFNDKS